MTNQGIKVLGTEGNDKYRLYYPGNPQNGKSSAERLYYVGEYDGLSGYDILTIDWGFNSAQTWQVVENTGNYTVILNSSLGLYTDLKVKNVEEIRFANGSWYAPISKTYLITTSASAINEGSTLATSITTTNVASGTTLYYSLSGSGITSADFSVGSLLGSGVVSTNGSFSFSHTLANDFTTEGTETLEIKLFSDSNRSNQVGSTATVSIRDTSTTPAPTISINGNNNGVANTGTINNSGTINTGTVNTNSGNTTNITNNNINNSTTTTIAPTTINNITNNTTNNIAVNAVITNTSAPTYNVSNTYAKNLVGDVLTGSPQLTQNSYDAKFYNLGGGRYGVQQKGKSTIDEITGATTLQFQDQAISLASDVAATFNQVKGIDDVSGVVFRLYNAAFARLPDAKGLENWINGNQSGGQTYSSSALEFAKSQEFKNRYGSNVSDTQYVNTLYNNVLGRAPDASGLAHYQGLLTSGKDRGSLLLDFSESPENRVLFTKTTGLS